MKKKKPQEDIKDILARDSARRVTDNTDYPTHFTSWGEWMEWTHPNSRPVRPKLSWSRRMMKKFTKGHGPDQ